MALRYTASQLLKLKRNYYLTNDIYTICGDAGIIRRKRYIHRSSRRSFAHLSSDVVSYPKFFRKPQRLLYRPAGINYNNLSVPIHKEISRAFSEFLRLLKSAFFNARSVNNKAVTLSDIIVEKNLDILCLVETWHKQSDGLLINELTPAGYGLFDLPQSSGRGGSIIVLYNQQYSLSPVAAPLFNSFECLVFTISESLSTAIVTVYRPPKANKDFLPEFAELLSYLCLKFERTLIQGDFNIHMDKKDSALTKDFLSLLECFELNQFVDCFTHNKGHILDLVISSGSLVSQLSTFDLGLSDHLAIFFDLYLLRV